jgi:hypothetical protein
MHTIFTREGFVSACLALVSAPSFGRVPVVATESLKLGHSASHGLVKADHYELWFWLHGAPTVLAGPSLRLVSKFCNFRADLESGTFLI